MKIQISYILTTLVLILNCGQLNAAVFPTFDGNSSGAFSNVVGGANVNISSQSVSWGTPGFLGDASSLTYAGSNPFTINNSDPFNIGDLIYSNTAINIGTGISNVDLTVNPNFTNPAFGLFDFMVSLTIDNTPNTGGSSANSDTVTLAPISGFPSLLGSIDNINYFFTILGFQDQNGGIVNSFAQAEGSSDSVALFAQISAVNQVPVPATFWLLLTALLGMFGFNRKRLVLANAM